MRAIDTNVLIYAHDPRDPTKQATAAALIESLTDGVLLWQVACEYVAASRKLAAHGFDQTQAWQTLNQLQQVWTTALPSWDVMTRAERLMGKYHLSFWDALIVAACLEAGVTHLFTEDMGGNPNVDGLNIVNPFEPDFQLATATTAARMELFDYFAQAEQASAELTAMFGESSAEHRKLSAKFQRFNAAIEQANQEGGARLFSKIQKNTLQAAEALNAYSRWLETASPRFEEAAGRLKEGFTFYFNNAGAETAEQRAGLGAERTYIVSLLNIIALNLEGLRTFRHVKPLGRRAGQRSFD